MTCPTCGQSAEELRPNNWQGEWSPRSHTWTVDCSLAEWKPKIVHYEMQPKAMTREAELFDALRKLVAVTYIPNPPGPTYPSWRRARDLVRLYEDDFPTPKETPCS